MVWRRQDWPSQTSGSPSHFGDANFPQVANRDGPRQSGNRLVKGAVGRGGVSRTQK